MDVLASIEKLKVLNDQLNSLNALAVCPVIPEVTRVTNLSLQYDVFMEFIGEYEDALNYLDSVPITFENEFTLAQTKKELQQFWVQQRYNF